MSLNLSIVTPCFNRADFIDQAVQSVRQQWRDGMEHIIADGGSTDGTLEKLAQYDHLTVLSEPDKNLYDAVNKGIEAASGDVIGWLNSDDRYLPGAFDAVLAPFQIDAGLDMVSAGARLVTLGTEADAAGTDLFNAPENKSLVFEDLLFDVPIINARFFRRRVFDKVGCFSLDFMPASDREFLMRCALGGLTNQAIGDVVHEYVLHGGSATIRGDRAHWAEMARVHLAIADHYVARRDLSSENKNALAKFHSKNALIGCTGAIGAANPLQALEFIRKGWSKNPLWPAQILIHLAEWAGRKRSASIQKQ